MVVKTTLKDASGAQVWSTRYISASAEAKPFTGDNGWFKDDARPLRLALEQSLKRSIDVMLRDVGRLRQKLRCALRDGVLFNSLLEPDLEDAILRELEHFLLELGAGFTFVACQKRLQIDNDDFYIDLLFYNRRLKRLVAIEMKLGEFKAADEGQMELYLRWLA
nr:PDDEXK nuclease domain-containing protein [Cupriavidus necator]